MRVISDEVLSLVREQVERGTTTPEVISMRTSIDIMTVERALAVIADERKPKEESTVEMLRGNLRLLQQLVETARFEYLACPDVDNATSVTQMISTSIATIKEIESRKDPATVLNEALARAIQPLFHEFVRHVTIAAGRLRDELYDAVPQQYHARTDQAIKELVSVVGRETSGDYKRTVEQLSEVLGCRPEEGKVQPLLKAVRTGEVSDGRAETEHNSSVVDGSRS